MPVPLRTGIHEILVVALVLPLAGCAYRLYLPIPPSEERIQIAVQSPDPYAVQLDTGGSIHEYPVSPDGRVTIVIPSYRFPCGVYLFNAMKVGGYADPPKSWRVSITRNGRTVRKLSLREVLSRSVDQAGYREVSLTN